MQPIENLDPDDFIDALFDPNDPAVSNDPLLQIIKHLYDTINTLITHINTNNATVDKVKDNLSSDIDLDTLASDVSTNNAKTGITTSQANAITDNTAKTGITTAQANAITENTKKTGITTSQASAITSNSELTAIHDIMRFRKVKEAGLNSKNTVDISYTWALNKITNKLEITMTATPAIGNGWSSVVASIDPIKKKK